MKTKVKAKVSVPTGVLVAVVLLFAVVFSAYGYAVGLRRGVPKPSPFGGRLSAPAQPSRCLNLKVAVEAAPTFGLTDTTTQQVVTFGIENPDRTCTATITSAQLKISSDNKVSLIRNATLISGNRQVPLKIPVLPTYVNVSFGDRDGLVIQSGGRIRLKIAFETAKDADKQITVEIPREGITWQDERGRTYRDPQAGVVGVIEGKAGTAVEQVIEISDLSVAFPDFYTAVVSFKTNVAAASEIEYGTNSDLSRQVADYTARNDHSLKLNVAPGTLYYYRVTAKSSEAKYFPATTPVYSFRTAPRPSDTGVTGGGAAGGGSDTSAAGD